MITAIFETLSSPWGLLLAFFFFGASIFVHELGHYLAARWRGLKIERFSIGMGPRIWGWTDKRGVEWRISAIPLGGYVLLPQLADLGPIEGKASPDSEVLPPLSYTDKMSVAVAGAVFNVIFAFALASVLWITGLPQPDSNATTQVGYVSESILNADEIEVPGPAFQAGILPGDRILSIDGVPVHDFTDIQYAITFGDQLTPEGNPLTHFVIDRQGTTLSIDVSPAISGLEKIRQIGVAPALESIIASTFENSPAQIADLREGDLITALNGTPIYHRALISEFISENSDSPLQLTIKRGNESLEKTLTPEQVTITSEGQKTPMIGVRWAQSFTNVNIPPHLLIGDVVSQTYRTLAALINPNTNVSIRNLSGPVGILNILRITAEQGILLLLWMVVLININLAILNVLPLPVLDGGHMVLATWQKIFGKPIATRLVAAAQSTMMLALLSMIIYVTYFDVRRINSDIPSDSKPSVTYIAPVFNNSASTPAQNPINP